MSGQPRADRVWIALVATFVFTALLTAGVTIVSHGQPLPGVTAALVGLLAAGVGLGVPTVRDHVVDAWGEHAPYVYAAVGLFGLGALIGVALFAAGVDLVDFFLELIEEELGDNGDASFSATFFVVQNTPPFVLSIVGAITLGLLTVIIMVFNGLLLGNIAVAVGAEIGFLRVVALLAPHGIFELPSLFVAAGVGFRLLHRGGQRVLGNREAFVTREYLERTAVLVVVAWGFLVLAAFVEAYLTVALADVLFDDAGGGLTE